MSTNSGDALQSGNKSRLSKTVRIQSDEHKISKSKSGDETKISRTKSNDAAILKMKSVDSSCHSIAASEKEEKIPHQVKPKPHFERSLYGRFPPQLMNYIYDIDPTYSNFVFSKKHRIGAPVVDIDLSYWTQIGEVLMELSVLKRPLEKVVIIGNPQADDAVVEKVLDFTDTLTHLHISNCPFISSQGILQLVSLSKVSTLDRCLC
jgi:hypothetical protein